MITRIQDKKTLEAFLRRDVNLRLYEIGDLDDFYFSHTTWFGSGPPDQPDAIVMLYQPDDLPVLSALNDANPAALRVLLSGLHDDLPERFYLHLTPGLEDVFAGRDRLEHHGTHGKMKLVSLNESAINLPDGYHVRPLAPTDVKAAMAFYAEAYPGNWFDPRMLQTGKYLAVMTQGGMATIAGVHVYSADYRIAVLGNIATHPTHRGRGLATSATALLCAELVKTVDHIGLNVDQTIPEAIRCYEKVGFMHHTVYEEYMVTRL